HQLGFLLQGLQKLLDLLHILIFRTLKNLRGAVHKQRSGLCFRERSPHEQSSDVLQQAVVENLVRLQALENFQADGAEGPAMELGVEEIRRLVKLLLDELVIEPDHAVFHQVGLGDNDDQHAAVRQIDKLDVLQQLFLQRRRQNQSHVARNLRESARGFNHQALQAV